MNIIELMLIHFSKYIRKRGNRMKIFLDAGHSDGGDAGAEGFNLREQDITFGIVMHLIKKLSDVGFEIMVSRENAEDVLGENVSTSLSKRISLANTWGADVFISIHCNASANSAANGTEVYTFNTSGKAFSLAKKIQSKIVEILGTTDRGTKTANFAVLRETSMPAVLVETAFISNKEDSDKLRTRQSDFANAIFMAVCDEYNVSYDVKKYETAEEILDKLTELIEITDMKTALEQIQDAKDKNNSLYWILYKIVNR